MNTKIKLECINKSQMKIKNKDLLLFNLKGKNKNYWNRYNFQSLKKVGKSKN